MLLAEGRIFVGDYHLKQGQRWRDAEVMPEAIAHYQAALRANPWNLEALYQLGSTWANVGEHERSLETEVQGNHVILLHIRSDR